MTVFDKIEESYKSLKPFVAYRKPNSSMISGFFMQVNQLFFTDSFLESGFVFAPFDKEQKAILIPKENAEFFEEEISFDLKKNRKENHLKEDANAKYSHLKIVDKAIEEIKNGLLKKVVISRKQLHELSSLHISLIFKRLLNNYSNALVYVWYHPKVGLWFGATPETLLEIQNNNFKTMSLAGTQVFKNTDNVIWEKKELEEQQLVTNFIEEQLQPISSNLIIYKTETIKAGNLLHLRTKVTGSLSENSSLKLLIRALHPTPAVCGLPRELAKSFIIDNENYKRKFYTGFLGEINLTSKNNILSSELFVNLRCMEVENRTAFIYIGGGITSESNAIKEWEETVSKSKTMGDIL